MNPSRHPRDMVPVHNDETQYRNQNKGNQVQLEQDYHRHDVECAIHHHTFYHTIPKCPTETTHHQYHMDQTDRELHQRRHQDMEHHQTEVIDNRGNVF